MKTVYLFICFLLLQSITLTGFLHAQTSVPDLRTRTSGSDWPTFLGPNGNGKSSDTGMNTDWPESGLPIVWIKETAKGLGAPSVAKGRLFLFDREENTMRLTCLNAETAAEIWQFSYPTEYEDIYGFDNGPRTTPLIDGNRVYIFGVEGMLHCLSVIDGSLIWKINTSEQFGVVQNFFGVGATPVIEGDLLICAIGGSAESPYENVFAAQGSLQGNGSGLVALNKKTGKIVWKSSDELDSYASPKIVTMNGKRQGLWFARGGLVSFNPVDGKVDFHYPWRSKKLETVNASNPVIVDDKVFISEAYEFGSSMIQVKPDGFEVVWQDEKRSRNKSLELHWTTAIHHEGYLYAANGRRSGNAALRCVEFATGKVMWSHAIGEMSSIVYVDGHFISLGERGTLTLFKANPEQAEILSSYKVVDKKSNALIEYPAWAPPIIANGYLYLHGKNRLVCLDLLK
ncbi:MAG: PQQ-binding-like beta-propeller repeat protein [Calditrichia bacterium]